MRNDGRALWVRLARTTGLTLLGVLLATLNFFNLRDRSEDISSSAFFALVAPFYSARLQNEPVVILYTKDALDRISKARGQIWTWPLSFDQQSLLLNNLVDLSPCSIFFDIGFYQERGDLKKFTDAIRNATTGTQKRDCGGKGAMGPSLLLVADLIDAPDDKAGSDVFRQLKDAGAQSVPVTWTGRENTYPLTVNGKLMPAPALWDDWCTVTKAPRCSEHAHAGDSLSLTWGIGVNDRQNIFTNVQGCESQVGTWWKRFGTFLRRLWEAILAAVGVAAPNVYLIDCPFALTIPADWIVLGIDPPDLARAIGGRMVLVGATLPGMTDFKPSPVNGSIAGVFLHATALDNFLRFGYGNSWLFEGTSLWVILHVFVLAIGTYIFLLFEEFVEERSFAPAQFKPAWKRLLHTLGYIALGVGGALMFTLLFATFFFALGVSPINWLGITTLLFLETARSLFPALFLVIFAMLAGKIHLPAPAEQAEITDPFEEEEGSG